MSDTIVTAAMTATELMQRETEIAELVGGGCDVYISTSRDAVMPALVAIYPRGLCGHGDDQHIRAVDWPTAIAAARAWVTSQAVVNRNATIRRMALAIISLTDEYGACHRDALIRQKFSAGNVNEFQAAACERANEMCNGRPFVVLP